MKKIAIFCVSYNSDKERDQFLASINYAAKKAGDKVRVDTFVANNTKEDNPGYFGAIKQLMQDVDVTIYDYSIISNVDLTVEEDFFLKLADYNCAEDSGWIAPQIWSLFEKRDRNPEITHRHSKKKLELLRLLYKFPILDTLYTKTLYRSKRLISHETGAIYAGHGSFIILTKKFIETCGKIDYPIFLYGEEIYLAEQCLRGGLKVMYVPEIIIYDSDHVSTGKINHKIRCRYNYDAINYIIKSFY